MKVSIVTAVYNRVNTIGHAIRSVQNQTWREIEHIVIDGASTDGTLDILQELRTSNTIVVSEKDGGIYDALNKGLSLATGDVIGFMHSDDYFADNQVIEDIVNVFLTRSVDAVYGDLDYVSNDEQRRVVRHWHAGEYDRRKLNYGWMPPHPAMYLRRGVTEKWGTFNISFKISADYDAILRYFVRGKITVAYIPRVLVKMRTGGLSNNSLLMIVRKSTEDYLALRNNHLGGWWTVILKNILKAKQLFVGKR